MLTWYRFEKPVFQWQQPPQVVGSPISPQPRRAPPPSTNKVIDLSPDALVHIRGLAVHDAWICCSHRTSLTVESDAAYARAYELAGCCICASETHSACRLHKRHVDCAASSATACGLQSVLPFEAVLLNSLRRLLTFVPQTNDLLTAWARTTADSPGRERMPTPNQSPTKSEMSCWLAHRHVFLVRLHIASTESVKNLVTVCVPACMSVCEPVCL